MNTVYTKEDYHKWVVIVISRTTLRRVLSVEVG